MDRLHMEYSKIAENITHQWKGSHMCLTDDTNYSTYEEVENHRFSHLLQRHISNNNSAVTT